MNHESIEDDDLLNPPGEQNGFEEIDLESRDDSGVDVSQLTQTHGAGTETQTSVDSSASALQLGYGGASGPERFWRYHPEYGIQHNPFPTLNSPLPGHP